MIHEDQFWILRNFTCIDAWKWKQYVAINNSKSCPRRSTHSSFTGTCPDLCTSKSL